MQYVRWISSIRFGKIRDEQLLQNQKEFDITSRTASLYTNTGVSPVECTGLQNAGWHTLPVPGSVCRKQPQWSWRLQVRAGESIGRGAKAGAVLNKRSTASAFYFIIVLGSGSMGVDKINLSALVRPPAKRLASTRSGHLPHPIRKKDGRHRWHCCNR